MTKRTALPAALLGLVFAASLFSSPAGAAGVVEDRGTLRATVGGGQVLTFSSPVRRIAVAEDKLAAVHLVSEREVLINGLSPGVTTLFIWLDDDRRVRYVLRVGPNVDFIAQSLREIDPRISADVSPDGSTLVLRGDVADARTSRLAKRQAEQLLRGSRDGGGAGSVMNLLRFPGITASAEDRLAAAVESIDARIRVRRIQVGDEADAEKDSFVLEGNVRTLQDLERVVILAERQLGGTGLQLKVAQNERVQFGRQRDFSGMNGAAGRGSANGNLQALGGNSLPSATGLAAQLSRGVVVTSESGRVISFLEIDELAQIMVSIRFLEVDRGKARKMGVNFRLDTEHVAIGNYVGPQGFGNFGNGNNSGNLGSNLVTGVLSQTSNLVASFVDRATSVLTAIDFLDSKNLVRAVAEPNILTLSGEFATVLVGGEVPIPTATSNQVATFQGVFFQDFGVRLDIRPTVDSSGIVTLEVAPSIVRPDLGLGVGTIPGFQIQTVQTVARVAAGESLVLGGLISFEESLQQRGLPGLQKVPLFRWKSKTHSEKELMFIITPQIVGLSSDGAREAALPALEWPEDRGEWIEAMRPIEYEAEGIPPSFVQAPEPAVLTPTPLPAPVMYDAAPAPMPAEAPPADAGAYEEESMDDPPARMSNVAIEVAGALDRPRAA